MDESYMLQYSGDGEDMREYVHELEYPKGSSPGGAHKDASGRGSRSWRITLQGKAPLQWQFAEHTQLIVLLFQEWL